MTANFALETTEEKKNREEFILATILDLLFTKKVKAIIPPGANVVARKGLLEDILNQRRREAERKFTCGYIKRLQALSFYELRK